MLQEMTSIYPLVEMITRLSALSPVLSQWESCALIFMEKNQPSSVSFICDFAREFCPTESLYKQLKVPSQTFSGLETRKWPSFHHYDMVFVFDDRLIEWDEQTIEKYRRGGRNKFKLVIATNSISFEYDFKSMTYLFAAMWLSGIVQCAVLLANDTSSQIYTYIPFKTGALCEDTTPVLIGGCSKGAKKAFDLTYKIHNLNQCPMRAALLLKQYPKDSLYGELSPLLQEIGYRMNASLDLTAPDSGSYGGMCGPLEKTGLRGMVYNGTVHMSFSEFSQRECVTLEYVGMGLTTCQAWCTPVLSENDYVFSFLVEQLQPKVWVGLMMSIVTVSASVLVLCAASQENWSATDVFNLSVAIYAPVPPANPRAAPARIVVAVWLWAILVLRAAYEGEMKSQSAVQLDTHIIYDLDELADTNLIRCLTTANEQILKADNNPVIQRIYKKSIVCNGSMYENSVLAAGQKDRAVFTTTATCREITWKLSKEKTLLYPLTGGCFKTLQMTPIITLRGSPFKTRWRIILNRSVQAGLIGKWLHRRSFQRGQGGARPLTVAHILPALFALGLGGLGGLLSLAVHHGLKIRQIHRILSFEQKPWLKAYVEKNTALRKVATNDFDRNFFKLMVNSSYGKCLESVRKRVIIKLVTRWDGRYGAEAYIAKPNFHSRVIFDENLVAIKLSQTDLLLNKPVYAGFSILEIAKAQVYDFHYTKMYTMFDPRDVKCLYTDTDSLIYDIRLPNVYEVMKCHLQYFDMSDYTEDNVHGMPLVNRKQVGLMADQFHGKIMTEFVGLRSKMYSVRVEGEDVMKKCKGVKTAIVKNHLSFEDYKKCLDEQRIKVCVQHLFRSRLHHLETIEQTKLALCPHDDKRYVPPGETDTLPWGHYSVPE